MRNQIENRFENLLQKTIEKTKMAENVVLGYQLTRTFGFALQNVSLTLMEAALTRSTEKLKRRQVIPGGLNLILKSLGELLKQDAENIQSGIYPWTVLKPRSFSGSLKLYPKMIWDGFTITKRRQDQNAHDFDANTVQDSQDLPEYYKRNFHYQTGGYLTQDSADLYEHQVEVLFSGSADAMRRLVLAPLRAHFGPGDGEGLRFLEIAAGTGRLSAFVKRMYPKARVTLLDLSDAYLRKARAELQEFSRIDFVQGDAANLDFASGKFDAVFSCFLFHELPEKERVKVLAEAHRVLKPGGFHGFVDSLQKGDVTPLDPALRQFPVDFHEPFYKNYTEKPMQAMLEAQGFTTLGSSVGFFSKMIASIKDAHA